MQYLTNGFPIWLTQTPKNLSTTNSNFANNKKELLNILKTFIKETKNTSVVPYPQNPKYIIPVFNVPKKDKNGKKTALRMVRHGSFHPKEQTSINNWIDPEKCKMPTLPNLKTYASMLLGKKYMTLRDLSDAFRQIGARKEDSPYLGYSIFGLKFVDHKQPYGIASAAANCQSFAQLIIWILDNKILPIHLIDSTLVHIDDFLLASDTKIDATIMMNAFDKLCNLLNIKISTHKNIDIVTKATVYGLQWDLIKQTVGIPDDKYIQLKTFIISILKCNGIISVAALDCICGRIMHWSQLRHPSKALCFNMIYFIYETIRIHNIKKTTWIQLPDYILLDLKFWLEYAQFIKEVPIESILRPPSSVIYASTDASDFAGGFLCGDIWSTFLFTETHKKNWHINQKEAFVILNMIYNLRDKLTGKKVIVHIDNTTTFHSISKKWSKTYKIMIFVYEICLLMIKYNIFVWVEWISSTANIFADALSRYQIQRFRQATADFNIPIQPNPLQLQYFNDFKFNNLQYEHYI